MNFRTRALIRSTSDLQWFGGVTGGRLGVKRRLNRPEALPVVEQLVKLLDRIAVRRQNCLASPCLRRVENRSDFATGSVLRRRSPRHSLSDRSHLSVGAEGKEALHKEGARRGGQPSVVCDVTIRCLHVPSKQQPRCLVALPIPATSTKVLQPHNPYLFISQTPSSSSQS